MKPIRYIVYVFLFALIVSSCTNSNDMPEFPTKYARIIKQNIKVLTREENRITVHADFDSKETAEEKFIWSVFDPELATVVTNADNSVTIEGIAAGQTTLKIESEDGKLEYFSTLNIQQAPDFYAVFIDFGTNLSGAPFNNFQRPSDGKLENLKDERGGDTGFAIEIDGSFNNFEIHRDIPNSLGFPSTASNDMFFNDGIDVASAGFILSNLNPAWKYTFVFYSSINDSGTQNEYVVKGKEDEVITQLTTAHNANNVAIVDKIVPNADGTIKITLRAGPENTQWARFYNINTMMIVAEQEVVNFPLEL